MKEILSHQFVGMHELRSRLGELLAALERERSEVVITRQGKPAAVMLDVETYLEMKEALEEYAHPDYPAALLEARVEIKSGQGVTAEEVFRQKGLG
jgi:prevent-host-death family protein